LVGVGEDLVFVQNCSVWVVVVVVVVVGGGMLYCWVVVVVDDFEIVAAAVEVVVAAAEVVAVEVAVDVVAVEVLVTLLMERYLEECAAFQTTTDLLCLWMRTDFEVDGMKTQLSGVTKVVVGCRCLAPDTVVTAVVEAVETTVVAAAAAVLVVAVDESVGAAAVATNAGGVLLMVVGVEELERGETAGAYGWVDCPIELGAAGVTVGVVVVVVVVVVAIAKVVVVGDDKMVVLVGMVANVVDTDEKETECLAQVVTGGVAAVAVVADSGAVVELVYVLDDVEATCFPFRCSFSVQLFSFYFPPFLHVDFGVALQPIHRATTMKYFS
jgi:hypothetical protein